MPPTADTAPEVGRRRLRDSYTIEIAQVTPDPTQPRKNFNAKGMNELEASIEARGIKQPITVRWDSRLEKYVIVDGERRYRSAAKLGLDELPCVVSQAEGVEVLVDQIVHNWQRANLKPRETADALARLRDEFRLSVKDLSSLTGKCKSEISKLLAIHDNVAPELLVASEQHDELTKRHLYGLSRLPMPDQVPLAQEVIDNRISAVDLEKRIAPKAKPGMRVAKRGLSARQRRISTTDADVVITFRRGTPTNERVAATLTEAMRSFE